ncbi:MAG: YidC/Oxa1 family membrane protein insertase [Lachnospiraceae bacterium]|nr:YidC/Oxa1 family membrane protein insertase [Lachnospiraceae bacterium]
MGNFFDTILGVPLGYAIYGAYRLTGSYGLAILIFAVVAKLVMFPIQAAAHKNSIRLLTIQPTLNIIKRRFAGNSEELQEQQYNLFKKERYNPFVGLIPLIVRLVLIVGVMQVMYHPLKHLLHIKAELVTAIEETSHSLHGAGGGAGEQLWIIQNIRNPQNYAAFAAAMAGVPGAGEALAAAAALDLNFIGLNLGEIPSLANPTPALLVVFLSGFTALLFCLVQNAISPGALSQGRRTNLGFTVFTVGLSLFFALVTPVGVGYYWTLSNTLGMIATIVLSLVYDPKKLAGEALATLQAQRKPPAALKAERLRAKEARVVEKADIARFKHTKKSLLFYAISGGQYKYYRTIIDYLLAHSEVVIHYLTNDLNDGVFKLGGERIVPYYVSQQKTALLLLRLDADIMVTTVPDLQLFNLKRSIVRDDIEYIYVRHALGSIHMILRERALDYYNTIFCVGPHQVAEMRRREEMAGLPKRNLVKAGYGLYDQIAASYAALSHHQNEKPQILIAPSWQADNIMETVINEMLDALVGKGYVIYVRPHPQEVHMFPERMEALRTGYSSYIEAGEIVFDLDFSQNETIFLSDILITDWSNIAFEFSYCTLKPCIFINTPMKIMNPNYQQYGLEVLNITLRDQVGVSVDIEDIGALNETVARLLAEKDAYREQIEKIVEKYLYYPGRSGEAGGKYILKQLASRQE